MTYSSPGNVDMLSAELIAKWNDTITGAYRALGDYQSRFFSLDPASIADGVEAPVSWFGDPAEPAFCLDDTIARELSDWGVRGRHELHNEYCEYRVEEQRDSKGTLRPKRIQLTTELREYWLCVAANDPQTLRSMCRTVLGVLPSWESLYGVPDPSAIGPRQRELQFARLVAGNGNDKSFVDAGIPSQPEGSLNRDNALFMSHPINGLDDLLYIVMFGASPYARQETGQRYPATKEQIFRHFGVEHLACRHADPAAATAAHQQAYEGRVISFANPLGVYINNFTSDVFQYQGVKIPASWVRIGRGRQRLDFGPSDQENVFLDDITVLEGDTEQQLTGGYEVSKRVEVGPLLRIGPQSPVDDDEFMVLDADTSPIRCSEAQVCQRIRNLRDDFEESRMNAISAGRRKEWRQ